jgi:hypothetical protein
MTKKEIANYVKIANTYIAYEHGDKIGFHREGKRIARLIAKKLGLAKGTFDIRSNRAGIACSGEVTLHGERIYIHLGQSCCGFANSFYYRGCNGRKDYCGKTNRWIRFEELLDIDNAVEKFRKEIEN